MRAVRIALVVSVALNLLIAGILFGAWLDRGPDRDPRLRDAGPMAPFAAAMERDDRRALLAGIRGEGRDSRPDPREFRSRFQAMLEAIRSDPFDRGRLEGVLAQQRTAAVARQEAGERLLVDRIARMSADERSAYAERLEAAFRRPHRH